MGAIFLQDDGVLKAMDERIKCSTCEQCNRKGKPSVMRGSIYCDVHQKKTHKKSDRKGFFSSIKDRLFKARTEKDIETGEIKNIRTRGFRDDYFYR